MKPEAFLLGLMDNQLERSHGTLSLYMTMAMRILYTQKWKYLTKSTIKEWLKMLQQWLDLLYWLGKRQFVYYKLETPINFLWGKDNRDMRICGFDDYNIKVLKGRVLYSIYRAKENFIIKHICCRENGKPSFIYFCLLNKNLEKSLPKRKII